MVKFSFANSRYTYINESEWPSESVGIHRIVVGRSFLRGFRVPALLANGVYRFLVKLTLEWIPSHFIALEACLQSFMNSQNHISEFVIIMPAIGVQLETHYLSGRIVCNFVPVGKILKPVLVECVTPVTCYWSLSLIVLGEEELTLVFTELRPPLKMLVPIWKSLCAATDNQGRSDTLREDG